MSVGVYRQMAEDSTSGTIPLIGMVVLGAIILALIRMVA